MASILCLAHYCDTHGPTPLMVTEGFTVACPTCHIEDNQRSQRRPSTSCQSTKKPEMLEKTAHDFVRTKSISSIKANDAQKTAQPNTPRLDFSSTTLETPPDSPRLAALSISRSSHRRESSFRKTYDENDRKRAIPCENCALTLPKKVQEQIPEGAPGSPMKSGKGDNGSPILRTRKAYERISTVADDASVKSTPSDSDDSERNPPARRTLQRIATSSSISSFASSSSQSHSHYLDYTSTHDPISSASFSILRASCLRTLSCETLPPAAASTAPNTPTSPSSYGHYRSFPSSIPSTASTSGGPIFFGDPLAGYTTAYIFRVPDPYARGRRRVYAFICLSSARERAAMRAFSFLAAAFRDLASWIQSLAETETDRLENEPSSSPFASTSAHENKSPTPTGSLKQYSASAHGISSKDVPEGAAKEKKLSFTPTSAFLSGRPTTFDPEGFARKSGYGLGGGIRSRGLAELVGRPEFFIELHARFVRLLAQLAVLFASGGV